MSGASRPARFPSDLQIASSRLSTALQRRREHGVAITGIEGCCACAVSAHAAVAPPISDMNSRLFNGNISRASNGKIPHLVSAGDLLHCGSSSGLRAAMGQSQRSLAMPHIHASPLHPESGQTGKRLAKSALCQSRPYATQQTTSWRS
jgi:hypothetical protein